MKMKQFVKNSSVVVGFALVAVLLVVALFGPLFVRNDPYKVDMNKILVPPSMENFFGTDNLGRDVMSRVVHGARISLLIGFLATLGSIAIGVAVGIVAGYLGGKFDLVVMRIVDVFFAFPDLLLAIGIMVAIGPGIKTVIITLSLVGWIGVSRLVRSVVISIKEKEFIDSAKAVGCSSFKIMWKYVFPNCLSIVLVTFTLRVSGAIMAESSLSFLGLGAQPPVPTWGSMISLGRSYIRTAYWLTVFPGILLALTVLGFNLLGDGLRDVTDPRLKSGKAS